MNLHGSIVCIGQGVTPESERTFEWPFQRKVDDAEDYYTQGKAIWRSCDVKLPWTSKHLLRFGIWTLKNIPKNS